MSRKTFIFILCIIPISVFLGIISRFAIEFYFNFNDEESHVSQEHDNGRDMAENKNVFFQISGNEGDIYSENILSASDDTFSEDNTELSLHEENRRLPEREDRRLPEGENRRLPEEKKAPAGSKNKNETRKLDLSGYQITPRKTDKNDFIPDNNAPARGVIRAEGNGPVKDIYLREETRKSNITIPVESVDRWIKEIWK